jgi:hypothetical protein
MSEYQPRGRVKTLIDAMQDDPHRVWTVPEVARLLKIGTNEVMAYVLYALKAEAIHRGKREGLVLFSLTPFPEHEALKKKPRPQRKREPAIAWDPSDDLRIPRFDPAWRPPVMVAPRAGSGR